VPEIRVDTMTFHKDSENKKDTSCGAQQAKQKQANSETSFTKYAKRPDWDGQSISVVLRKNIYFW